MSVPARHHCGEGAPNTLDSASTWAASRMACEWSKSRTSGHFVSAKASTVRCFGRDVLKEEDDKDKTVASVASVRCIERVVYAPAYSAQGLLALHAILINTREISFSLTMSHQVMLATHRNAVFAGAHA